MTNPSRLNVKNLLNGMLFGLVVVMLMLTTVGCDKKKSNNNNFANCLPNQYCAGPGFPGGPGIPGQPGFGNGNGIVGLGYDYNYGAEMFLEFVVQSQGYTDPFLPSGQAYLYGQLSLQGGLQCGFSGMGVQPGFYSIQSQYPVNVQNGVINGAQVTAVGQGGYINLYISYATIQSPYGGVGGQSQYLPLMANVSISSINDIPCNQSLSFQP